MTNAPPPLARDDGSPHDLGMEELAALEGRVGKIESALMRLEAGIEGIRHVQNIGLGAVALCVAVVGLLVTVGIFEIQNLNSSVSATNVRLDTQLQQQAAAATAAQSAANARMDRLLELYAQQSRVQALPQSPAPPSSPPSGPAPGPTPGSTSEPTLRPQPGSFDADLGVGGQQPVRGTTFPAVVIPYVAPAPGGRSLLDSSSGNPSR